MPANIESLVLGSNQSAWHMGGVVLPDDCLTWQQITDACPQLGYRVAKNQVYVIADDGRPVAAPDYSGIVREDGVVLGINGDGYEPVQAREAFDFMSELLQRKEAVANTAGTLDGGRKMFVCCLAPESFFVGGESTEEHRGYVSFVNSYDGSTKVGAVVGATRIVCQNTYNAAISGAKNSYWFRHTKNVMSYLEEARKALQVGAQYWHELERLGNQAIRASFSDKQFTGVLDELIPITDVPGRKRENAIREQDTLRKLFRDTEDIQNIRGTAWAAVNAITAFSDHHIVSRQTDRNSVAQNRLKRVMFDASLKDRATAMIYEMAEIR